MAAFAAPPAARKGAAASDRLVNSPTDNYVANLEFIGCWRADRMPLKVYIQPAEGVANLNPEYVQIFKTACQSWALAMQNKISFTFVDSPADCDIDVQWSQKLSKDALFSEMGNTCPRLDSRQTIEHATITLLTKLDDKRVSTRLMRWTALHELGHALGLGHSGRKADVMFPRISSRQFMMDGEKVIDVNSLAADLSGRDTVTMNVVYTAKRRLDGLRGDRDTRQQLVALFNEAKHCIDSGDSGTAIILLNEMLRLDSTCKVAYENLMAAYYNCAAELYNKEHYADAVPVLDKAMSLARKYGNGGDLSMISAVYRNCQSALARH